MAKGNKPKPKLEPPPAASPPPVVVAAPAPPVSAPAGQVFMLRRTYRCTTCGSTRVKRNGGSPESLGFARFTCFSCTDDEGNARTFKLPLAR
jgi:hypothetical protein